MPSFTDIVSSTRSWIIGLAPSEYSMMKLARRRRAQVQAREEAGRTGPKMRCETEIEARWRELMRIASVMPPQKAGSGWNISAARSMARSRKAKRVASLSPAAIGTLPAARTSAMPGLSSAVTGSSNQARSQSRDQLDEALGLGHGIGAMRIDHEVDVGSRCALRAALYALGRDVRAPIHGADAHLDGLEAAGGDIGPQLLADPVRGSAQPPEA